MTMIETENHVDALDDLTDAELEAAIREGVSGALTESALRDACGCLGIKDRAKVMPSFAKDRSEKRTRTVGPKAAGSKFVQLFDTGPSGKGH